jgi:hypothetical protein
MLNCVLLSPCAGSNIVLSDDGRYYSIDAIQVLGHLFTSWR